MEFEYKAKDETGKTVSGVMDAEDEDSLATLLDEQNLFLVEAAPAKKKDVRAETGRIKARDVLNFTLDLSTILSSGIPITDGLADLAKASEHVKLQAIIEDILASINAGSSLSAAFERHPKVFDTLYVSIVRAGETSGSLDRVLSDLAVFLEWKADLRRDVIQAMIYPAMVLTAISGLVILLATVVFPQFATVLNQSKGTPIPLPTQILFFLSTVFRLYWWVMLTVLIVAVASFWMWVRTPRGRAWFDAFKLKLPVFGNLTRDIALSRFCHFFQILFSAGVDISQTLTIVEALVGNHVLAEATREVRNEIRAGNSISQSLAATGRFPTMVVRMFHIGESSGQLVGSLEKACRYYDKEIPATIKRVFSIMEPVLYIFLAFIVLTVALAIYMPLYQMMGGLSQRR